MPTRLFGDQLSMQRENRDRLRYNQDKAEWIGQHPDRPMGYLNRKRKEPGEPKRVQPPFSFFRQEMRPKLRREMAQVRARERDGEIARRWLALDENSRDKYRRLSIKDQVRYTREMAVHRLMKLRKVAQQRRRLEQLQAAQQVPNVGPVPNPPGNVAPQPAPGP